MLAITKAENVSRTTPNLLPCAIKHSGPVTADARYWTPTVDEKDGNATVYFRGRKLRGREIKVPAGYEGALLQKSDKPVLQRAQLPRPRFEDEENDVSMVAEDSQIETTSMDKTAEFENIVVWGHEAVPGDEDVYVRGIQEWMSFADAVHSYDDTEQAGHEPQS